MVMGRPAGQCLLGLPGTGEVTVFADCRLDIELLEAAPRHAGLLNQLARVVRNQATRRNEDEARVNAIADAPRINV